MRVLLYAEALNPQMSSEPYFIYKIARAIIDHVDEAVVVTQMRNREAIEAEGLGGAEVIYLDTEYIARPISRVSNRLKLGIANLTAAKIPVHYAFEAALWKQLKARIQDGEFDVVHRLGPISSAIPSPLASWSKTPFVIGPVNGGLPFPPHFTDLIGKSNERLRYIRNAYKALPYARGTFRNASAILAAFDHTIETLPPSTADKIFNVPEVGADPDLFAPKDVAGDAQGPDRPTTFFMAGRMLAFKCMDVAVRAFVQSEHLRNQRLVIAGDGPERATLEKIVADAGAESSVEFLGWTSLETVADHMNTADVFVFPSVRDSGAGVIVEAMMASMPSIVVGYGPGQHLLDDDSGIRVPLGTREDHVIGFQAAMERLSADPHARIAMGKAARERALQHLSWDQKGRKIADIYRWATKQDTQKPADLLSSAEVPSLPPHA